MTLEVVLGSIRPDPLRAPVASPKEPVLQNRAIRVLVVDDEPLICTALSTALRGAGYDVVSAQSGEAAVETVRGEYIDVMLIDLRIPDMRGDVVYEVAAATQPHLSRQTLFMTGDITENAHALIAACKCNFLRKPFNLGDMIDAIAAVAPRVHERERGQTA
jgi:DNA-binding NtrC family response regulator